MGERQRAHVQGAHLGTHNLQPEVVAVSAGSFHSPDQPLASGSFAAVDDEVSKAVDAVSARHQTLDKRH